MERPVFSVTELNTYVKDCLEQDPLLRNVCVSGELSNYKIYPSGHHYFSLKDSEGAVSCVMFRSAAASLRFRPDNGMTVLVCGKVSVYPRDGRYQLYVSAMMVSGAGDLHLAFEQLKAKLEKEGLFAPERKQRLPVFPGTVALITSPVGAAVRDMIRILGARWPMAKVLVVPVRVQGKEAAGEICEAIRYVNQYSLADVIITGRGGGSLEDLWAFNEEAVARAVAGSRIPVISAVGHEPDVMISDYVADMRASTPSNGAERCVPDRQEVAAAVKNLSGRLQGAITHELTRQRKQLQIVAGNRVLQDPRESLNLRRMDLDMLREKLCHAEKTVLDRNLRQVVRLSASLDALSPLKVLSRGYAVASDTEGHYFSSVLELCPENEFLLTFSDGTARCVPLEVGTDIKYKDKPETESEKECQGKY